MESEVEGASDGIENEYLNSEIIFTIKFNHILY